MKARKQLKPNSIKFDNLEGADNQKLDTNFQETYIIVDGINKENISLRLQSMNNKGEIFVMMNREEAEHVSTFLNSYLADTDDKSDSQGDEHKRWIDKL
ncbi:hypothetical protein [Zunongwangia profunda]|uniref:hypothetical protein n=1 Tax=Zunongwangia profunda TaxID=398743 RepID=UPI001D18AA60|nr:hypothetical protein [Zunongwangia profunda]MCC4228363.1 hypothetical protein [Zunongwangia profunda]